MFDSVSVKGFNIKSNFISNISPYKDSNKMHLFQIDNQNYKANKIFCKSLITHLMLQKYSKNGSINTLKLNSKLTSISYVNIKTRKSTLTLLRAPYRYKVAKLSIRFSRFKSFSLSKHNLKIDSSSIKEVAKCINALLLVSSNKDSTLLKLCSSEISLKCYVITRTL